MGCRCCQAGKVDEVVTLGVFVLAYIAGLWVIWFPAYVS